MKRILINATQNEEIRVALCKGNHLYDFDLENRTREQKKSNIYKAHVTRVEPSLEAVFVEYGSQRQGFLPIREISNEYLSGNPRDENIKKLIKEGDELIVQVEKEERGNKGAALSTYVSLAGRYLVLMPNNPRGGGISRQISGKLREDMKRMLANLDLPKGMSVIIRTAGIGKTQEDLQHDLNHLLNIWQAILEQNKKFPSPRLVHQEAGVVTRAVRDYLRDDISEIWIDNENAFIEAANFIDAVMPKQADKLRKYTDYEPMFARFNIEKQIETAYQREVRLPSGGSIVIDQTEALVSIDINSAKSTKGSDVAETAYHTNLEAADEIARQLRLRDMGGLIVIDFIDMSDSRHQKEVEKRLVEATKYDRARVQFGEISKFGLMEMSRQRLRPSLEESTGYICPRCHGNGMIRDLRSLSLSIMRQIEQIALKERQGEVQAEVPTDIAAFLLNEKRDSLVYLEQDSGTRITILPHAHLESPNFKLHFNRDGFAPSSYERITDTQQQEFSDLGYDVDWQTADSVRPEQQPTRKPRSASNQPSSNPSGQNGQSQASAQNQQNQTSQKEPRQAPVTAQNGTVNQAQHVTASNAAQKPVAQKPATPAVAWLSNLFAQAPQATLQASVSSNDAASAIETLVNSGAQSLGAFGQVDSQALATAQSQPTPAQPSAEPTREKPAVSADQSSDDDNNEDRRKRKPRKPRASKPRARRDRDDQETSDTSDHKKSAGSEDTQKPSEDNLAKRKPHSQRSSRGKLDRGEPLTAAQEQSADKPQEKAPTKAVKALNPDEVVLQINEAPPKLKAQEVVHLSLDEQKPAAKAAKSNQKEVSQKSSSKPSVETSQAEKPSDRKKALTENTADESGKGEAKAVEKLSDRPVTDHAAPSKRNLENAETAPQEQASKSADQDANPADYSGLFAKRYVTAQKFGQASNDPRVVREQQKASVPSPVTARPELSGSVGEFIHATLPDAADKLSQQGIIRSFIEAISQLNRQSQMLSLDSFSFVNYGYAPLASEYLAQFDAMITPVSQFGMSQGKTAVPPRAIGKRASNDPRGQHPDFQNQMATETSQSHDSHELVGVETTETQTTAELNAADKVEHRSENSAETDINAHDVEAHDIDAKALSSESKADEVSIESENLLQADVPHQELLQSEPSAIDAESKDDSQSAKSKTTIASYKNMIENVAEQLLPQTGMFNLTTPKVPKARTRKPKTEHKKPTQAEKAEAAQDDRSDDDQPSS